MIFVSVIDFLLKKKWEHSIISIGRLDNSRLGYFYPRSIGYSHELTRFCPNFNLISK